VQLSRAPREQEGTSCRGVKSCCDGDEVNKVLILSTAFLFLTPHQPASQPLSIVRDNRVICFLSHVLDQPTNLIDERFVVTNLLSLSFQLPLLCLALLLLILLLLLCISTTMRMEIMHLEKLGDQIFMLTLWLCDMKS